MKRGCGARVLNDEEYDAEGWPIGRLSVNWRTFCVAKPANPPEWFEQSCWVAELSDLPGYYGEGRTISEALERLKVSLGPRPHFRVDHKFRSPEKLKSEIERRHKATAAAALSRADGLERGQVGGGAQTEARAREQRVGKTEVNAARAKLAKHLPLPGKMLDDDGNLVLGVSEDTLRLSAKIASELCAVELRLAAESPWRLEHKAAREKFPAETD